MLIAGGAGERAQLVKILARQGLEFDPQNSCKQQNKNENPGVAVHACNPGTGKAETGGPLVLARQQF